MPRGELKDFRIPGITDRTAIYGRTGDGKTVLAAWLLSKQAIDRMPWIVLDYKRDDLLNKIRFVKTLGLRDKLPREPGVYKVHPVPEHDDALVENLLQRIWHQRGTGLFCDEGFMVPNPSTAFNAILTQGRSLRIPVINLSQRPVWLNRFVTSQADCHALFPFNDDRDNETVLRFMPREIRDRLREPLPPYHCYWFDVKTKFWFVLGTVPPPDQIAEEIETRLRPKRVAL